MNFLKSVLSSGGPPGLALGDRRSHAWYTIYDATQRDGTTCSCFEFARRAETQNYITSIRSLRHPGVVRYLSSHETADSVYLVTERVTPLRENQTKDRDRLLWGLWQLAETLKFINAAGNVHGNVTVDSVFCSEAGEWRLAGFELLCEGQKTTDALQYGHLMAYLFNGSTDASPQNIPKNCLAQWRRLLHGLSVADFLEHGRRQGGWFCTPLIAMTKQIPQLALKQQAEVEAFLTENDLDKLPPQYITHRVVPELFKSLEFCPSSTTIQTLERLVSTQQQPAILRLWSNPNLRLLLLQHPHLTTHLSDKQVNEKVLSALESSFGDAAPALRERALLATAELLPRLTDRSVNNLLKCLARTANDREPGIRTNTTVCLAKMAPRIDRKTRPKVLAAALCRALRDPFTPARDAALRAAAATSEDYDAEQLCTKMLPGVVSLLLDPEGDIRRQARRTMDVLVARCDELAKAMPETLTVVTSKVETVKDTTKDTTSWTSWAVANLSKNLDALEVENVRSTASSPGLVQPTESITHTSAPIVRTSSTTAVGKKGLKLERKTRSRLVQDVQPPIISTSDDNDIDNAWGDDWDVQPTAVPAKARTEATSKDEPMRKEDADEDADAWDAGW